MNWLELNNGIVIDKLTCYTDEINTKSTTLQNAVRALQPTHIQSQSELITFLIGSPISQGNDH